ncbi:hypothetical protein IG631_18912 [Alternaria alternata]|nr:hypothetical protein IG631_18912 [Alternaria alternata]
MASESRMTAEDKMSEQHSDPQEPAPKAGSKQEQSTSEKGSSKGKSSKPRHRASVACASCRDRRIRVCLL